MRAHVLDVTILPCRNTTRVRVRVRSLSTHARTHTLLPYNQFFPLLPISYWRVRMVMIPRPQVGGVMSGPATTVASAMPL